MQLGGKTLVTPAELAREQTAAASHLTFTMTLACPLRCAHCIVGAGPEKGYTTMPLAIAERYAAQMGELYDHGIRMISFTGGEPLLARPQLRVMSDAAAAAGMTCGVVTAAHWASSPDRARAVVEDFPGLSVWDLSLDVYHQPYFPYAYVRTAYEAARACNRFAIVRFAYHDPPTAEDEEAVAFLEGFAAPEDVRTQRIRAVGRAEDLATPLAARDSTFLKPCMTKGLVVRYDGTTAPCCINLVEERRHPFQFGDARTRPLTELHAEYLRHPLLQMIRVLGFGEVAAWLKQAGLDSVLPAEMPEDVCDLCPHLMTNSQAAALMVERCSDPETRLKIAILARHVLDEPRMLEHAVDELAPVMRDLPGFAAAADLARQPVTAEET
ncbi:MAG: radical SAM protein [Hyphomicrobiales bacterium]|nr:MAG: radical SAM protein [Hyphomicrobiales bacterium]